MGKPAPLPTPVELGFPAKFAQFYDDQLEAIDRIIFNKRRVTALAMPTGSGKSVTGVAAALLHPEVRRAIYLTSTKGLQDQLATDFQQLGLLDLRGQRNYPCVAVEPGGSLDRYRHGRLVVGCDEGPCHSGVWCQHAPDRKQPHIRPDCAYYARVFDARLAPLVVSNYAMFLASKEYTEGLGHFDLVILDEAHDADKELESFLAVELTSDDCKYLSSKFQKGGSLEDWKKWANFHRGILASQLERLEIQAPTDVEGVRERRKMKLLLTKLKRLADIEPLKWAIEEDGLTAKFAPIRVGAYAEAALFQHISHVVLMSATLTHKTLGDLGIARDQYTFWEAPSRFPVAHRPIISVETTPAVRVNFRMDEEDKFFWCHRIDRIAATRHTLGWKGLIHTVSYERMRDLHRRSEHRELFVIHDPKGHVHGPHVFHRLPEAIAYFKDSSQPLILVSPSIITGYDFPDDDCRYQIIAKVPLPDMRGPIMKARGERDKEYAGYLAMQKLVQACGRPVRGPHDWAETFIVDDVFSDYFYRFNRKHAPRWFQDAVERVDYLPEPLVIIAA